ncbi:MAG: tetratricopeptide repeat protein [Phycisphaerae bacterium]
MGQKLDAMIIENQKTDLEHLSYTWHERVKNIRAMARRCKKTNTEYSPEAIDSENTIEVPSDNELFAGPVCEELLAQQVFAGNEDIYQSLKDTQSAGGTQSLDAEQIPMVSTGYRRFLTVQKVLAASIALVLVVLLYAIFKSPLGLPSVSVAEQTSYTKPPVIESISAESQQVQSPEPVIASTQPLSLNVAQSFYLNGDYAQALGVYEKLRENFSVKPEEDMMRDFLQLRMASCMEKKGDYEQANRLFRSISQSRSPAVRVMANYRRSLLEMQQKQYLEARTKAYQAIALIDAVDFDKNWALSLKQSCYFLVAEAVTRKALSLCDGDNDLSENLWTDLDKPNDPFANLDETQLRTILNSGSEQLSKVVLGPQILKLDNQSEPARYDVACNGASVEELLTRFAANANLDIHWALEPTEIGIRKQAVGLHLSAATTQQFITVAAGCAGLLARLNGEGTIDTFNPAECSYVSEQMSLLGAEAVSLWQNFLLRFPSDTHLANAHFALGLLQAQQGQSTEPIAEYKLVANQFSNSPLAPLALLNSSKLKTSMRDYPGACQDLKQLVEQYPDADIAGEAYLCLADATTKTGLLAEAVRLYSKVYTLNLSEESQITAALGAGKCSYEIKDYESTMKWLTRYITLAREGQSNDLYLAYFLLGKAYLALDNSGSACEAFQYALQGGPLRLPRDEYIETVSALVEEYIKQGNFVQALDTLEDIHSVVLSQQESIAILLLKSKALRAMGLIDEAVAILGDRIEFISDPQLKAKMSLELADCDIEKGNFEPAREKLTKVLIDIEAGPLAHEIALKLADVCLKLGQNSQAESICLQLLDMELPEQIKQKTLTMLSTAYNQQKDYDRAALALLGQWK